MPIYRYQPIIPKNGIAPHTLNPNRISGCVKQLEISLEDQHAHAREVVGELWDGDISKATFHEISTKGKGEDLTRPELEEIESQLRTSIYDLMVLEDVGRLVRGTEALRLIGVDDGLKVKEAYTFAAPRAGDAKFARSISSLVQRVEFGHDIVPHVPLLTSQ